MKSFITSILICTSSILFAQNIAVTSTSLFEGEPYLAIDPNNPQTLTAAWMSLKLGDLIVIRTSTSFDGGITWSTPTYLPHEVPSNTSADVSMDYDANGNLYICYIDFDNVNFSNGQVVVRKSTDNGLTWGPSQEAISISDCPNKLCVDRPWIVVDKTSGPNSGTIYVTSTNANEPTYVSAPYHPYIAISTDGGNSFSTPKELDTTDFLAGSIITQPLPSPVVTADGTFYAGYPSYVPSQNLFAQMLLASSTNAGVSFDHFLQFVVTMAGVSDPYAKRASLLVADPDSATHLGFIFLSEELGDVDVFYTETYDLVNWSNPVRVNDDPIGNNRMQDQVWGSFNENGDLAICWRDRRNASTSGYQTETETYGAVRFKDSTQFEANFPISSVQSPHDTLIDGAGNDFICVKYIADTVYTIWGDVRSGTINIYLNKTNVTTGITSVHEIAQEKPVMEFYPNPASEMVTINNFETFSDVRLINEKGQLIKKIKSAEFSVSELPIGTYWIFYKVANKQFSSPLVIK